MAGTAWLLQFIEDLQQSREFHKTCKLEPFEWNASKIPEVRHSYSSIEISPTLSMSRD